MLKITIDGIDRTLSRLESVQKQVPFAASRAINSVAFDVMRKGRAHITANLDRPTRWTVSSWYVRRKATKRDLIAAVGWSDYLAQKRAAPGEVFPAAHYYLSQHWAGGGRKLKAFERQLQKAGFLPAGHYAVPGKAAADLGMIDSNGNMKSGAIIAIMSGLGAFDNLGYNSNATVRQSKKISANKAAQRQVYWAGKPGRKTPAGIWALDENYTRSGMGDGYRGRLRPVMIFVSSVTYRKRLQLEQVAAGAQQGLQAAFEKELKAALATAR
jgi:hypothetical protein